MVEPEFTKNSYRNIKEKLIQHSQMQEEEDFRKSQRSSPKLKERSEIVNCEQTIDNNYGKTESGVIEENIIKTKDLINAKRHSHDQELRKSQGELKSNNSTLYNMVHNPGLSCSFGNGMS